MPTISYILIKIASGKDRKVHEKVTKLKQVKEAALVYGECDLIMKVEVEDFAELDALIFDTLRKMDGVESTKTLIGVQKTK